jgi:Condensation domain
MDDHSRPARHVIPTIGVPQTAHGAPVTSQGAGQQESPPASQALNPAIESRARQILGLDDLETLPNALAPRAEQLWRLDGFAADVPFTNAMFVPMGQSADIGMLYESVATVVGRHEALRTRLALQGNRAIQIAEDWKVSAIEMVEIQRRDLADDQPGRKSAVSEFTQAPLDLYAQDGFRCRAFRDEDQNVTLGFLAHGFFSDAWSSQILFREIRAVHAALGNREVAILKPALQFAEYARVQRRSLDRDLPSHLAYWHQKLKDMPQPRLPYDHDKAEGRRGRSYFFLDNDVAERLAGISQTNRVSLTLVLMAIYQLSLARWSGQTEILSAAYTADRIRPEFQNTIGFLVTNMPVCARFNRGDRFLPFLRDFAREFYGGYAHRELSCELYDAIFSPVGPFCATVFNFVPLQKNFFDSELHAVPSFDGTLIGPDASRPSIYREIYLGLAQYPNGILGKLFYNADRFTPEGMENFIRHFRNTVNRVAADPDAQLHELLR